MTPTTPSPISHERAFHIALVLEMSELSDRNSPENDPSAMVADSNEMAGCIERALERADLVLAPPVSEPVAWWNGFRKDDDERDGLSGPAFSSVETTWHDIPLYAGINPCNLPTAPTTGSAPDMRDAYVGAREDLEDWKRRALGAEDLNRQFMRAINGATHMGEPVIAAPASPAASVLTDALKDCLTMIDRIKKHCQITDNAGYTDDGRMLRLKEVEENARALLSLY